MRIIFADEFQKQFRKLPSGVQKIYRKQEDVFRKNWRDPRLHVKKLKGYPLPFSFRITRRYRAFFVFVDIDNTLFATIGHRKDSYRD